MAGRLLLDTDVLVEYLRGRGAAVEYVEGFASDLHLSVISVAELFAGIRGDDEESSLERFHRAFTFLPVTEKTARPGELYRQRNGPSHRTGPTS